jgi:hypothetical protein
MPEKSFLVRFYVLFCLQIGLMLKRTLLIICICAFGFAANAQFRLGPEVGFNFNRQIHKSNSYRFERLFSSQFGYSIGAIGDWVITDYLSLQPELIYTFKGGQYNMEEASSVSESYKARLGYISMPITLVAKKDVKWGYLIAGAGGYVSKLMFSAYTLDQNGVNVNSGSLRVGSDFYADQIKAWDAGIKVKAGLELKKGFFVNAFYDIGAYDVNPQFTTTRNKTIGVQTGFIFSLTEEDRYERFENFYEF